VDYPPFLQCHEPLVHEKPQSRSAGGASSTQRRDKHIESMTILSVAYSMSGTKAPPAHRSILGLVAPIFRSQVTSDVERGLPTQCRARRIKVLGREQSQPSSYFALHSHPSQTMSNNQQSSSSQNQQSGSSQNQQRRVQGGPQRPQQQT